MKRAALYIRVSTAEQVEGVSLEAQEAALTAYCAMRGLEVVQVITDAGVSAGRPLAHRPGGHRLLRLVENGQIHAVVAYKLDRVFRDAADCLVVTRRWDDLRVSLHLVDMGGQAIDTSTAMGRFFLTVIAGAAEMERNLIRERTSAAMQHKIGKRERVGRYIDYGWRLNDDGVHLRPHVEEQVTIAVATDLRASGMSLRAIGRELTARGHYSRSGRAWSAQGVKTVLEARVAAGEDGAVVAQVDQEARVADEEDTTGVEMEEAA